MILFFIGIVEMIIVTVWTKVVTKTQIWSSGIITLINVLVWYYVLQTIVDNINNWVVALMYALGCAVGTMVGTFFYQRQELKSLTLKNK